MSRIGGLALGLALLVSGFARPAVARPQILSPAEEPTVFICGIWPDRIVYFDQTTDTFSDGFRLRHGAVTGSGTTPDRGRFFLITDRMESVEVVDPIRREVVDEFELSTPERRIRIFGVVPDTEGKKAFLSVSSVRLEVDRFLREEHELMLYDLETRELVDEVKFPDEVMSSGRRPNIHPAPDGKSIYVIGRDVYRLSTDDYRILEKLTLSKPLHAGYGAFRGLSLTQTEPGVFYGIYRTDDPVQQKRMFGLARLDLYHLRVENYELGPDLRVGRFALSPDGKRGYAGLHDLVVVDMEKKKVLRRKEGFERGRTNNSMIVSHDGSKLYVSGVGDTVYIYDASTLNRVKTVFAGGDFMLPPVELPSRLSSESGKP